MGYNPAIAEQVRLLAACLAERGLGVVYGGGNVGLMGLLADEMLQRGGEVIGVIPQKLANVEIAHRGLTQLHVVATMHERKALMAELADAFIALPGGIGTLEEIIEAMTWTQLGYQHKPCGVLNSNGFYDALNGLLEVMATNGFLRPEHRELLLFAEQPYQLVEQLLHARPQYHPKWIAQ